MGRNFIWSTTRIYPWSHTFLYFSLRSICLHQNKDVASYADETTPCETVVNFAYITLDLEVLGNTRIGLTTPL